MPIKYENDFLDKVIVRIDFDTILPFTLKKPPMEIYEQIKERFPIVEEKKIIAKEFLIGSGKAIQRDVEKLEWYYHGTDRNKYLKITPDCLIIEYKKYEYYEQLKEDFIAVINELFNHFPKIKGRRLGFRYIDVIDLDEADPTDWDQYILPDLNKNISIIDDKKTLSRIFHVIEFNYGDSNMRFQYGMLNPDFPASIKKKVFTLDFDMYTNNILEKEDIGDLLDKFHEKLKFSNLKYIR